MSTPENSATTYHGSLIDEKLMPQVALEFMQLEHDEILRKLQGIEALIARQQAGEPMKVRIDHAINEILEHTQSHFSREEESMKRYHYLPLNRHKAEHDQFLGEIIAIREKWLDTGDISAVKLYFLVQVPTWFMQHLNSMDLVAARFIATQLNLEI